MADAFVETSNDANQDSLDGAQPPVSDVGSAEEFDKDREEDTPSASNGDAEADGNTADVPELPTDESREAEGAVGDEPASLDKEKEEKAVEEEAPKAENGDKNGHENGTNGDAKPEADSTEADALVAEKRKSLNGDADLTIKKARLDDDATAETEKAASNGTNGTNGDKSEEVAA